MDEKLIINNKKFIATLCKRFLNYEITESNFKEGYYEDDEDIFLTYMGNSYVIRFNPIRESYEVMHRNTRGLSKNKTSYHRELEGKSLPTLIYKLSTRHNPKDMVNKDLLKSRGLKLD